jgi:beta-phosphoglucomutase-like phosphatase (HAD superfamily)
VAEADYHVYEFAKVWNVSPDSANEIVHAFFASPHFADGVPPIPGAAPALARMGRYAKLAVVTSRQHVIRDATLDWLDAHFPDVFAAGGVHFGNHWALSGTSRTKAEMCAELGASILIDDNPRYAVECAAAGVDVLLYDWEGGYPWAKLGEGEGGDRITVVRDWREVEAAVAAVAAARR